jgi:hypothetical protein
MPRGGGGNRLRAVQGQQRVVGSKRACHASRREWLLCAVPTNRSGRVLPTADRQRAAKNGPSQSVRLCPNMRDEPSFDATMMTGRSRRRQGTLGRDDGWAKPASVPLPWRVRTSHERIRTRTTIAKTVKHPSQARSRRAAPVSVLAKSSSSTSGYRTFGFDSGALHADRSARRAASSARV